MGSRRESRRRRVTRVSTAATHSLGNQSMQIGARLSTGMGNSASLDALATFVRAVSFVAFVSGCGEGSPGTEAPSASNATTAPTTTTPLSETAASPSAASSASTASVVFEGKFMAKKKSVALQSPVTEKAWKKDDGTAASGSGAIELRIGERGHVSGKGNGVWGDLVLSGEREADDVFVTLGPEPGRAISTNDMRGIGRGHFTADTLELELEASSGDATIVREAKAHLERVKTP